MNGRWTTALLLALALVAAPAADAARARDGIREQKLPNGLTLVLVPDPRAGGVDVTVWYRAGTRWEDEGRTGVTHVVEQLMFRGTQAEGGDYVMRVRRLGGTVGAESTPDFSSFFQTVPPQALEQVLEMEAARMAALDVSPAAFAEVMQLVRQSRARSAHTPVVRGLQRLYAEAFEGHPYARPAIGLEADLDALTLEVCTAWHRARYGPGNAVVTIVGRFDPGDALAAAKRTLARVPRRPSPKDAAAPLPKADAPARRARDTYAFQGPSVLLGWRIPGASDAEIPALETLARCLGGDAGAPLESALLGPDRPAAYVQCALESRREAGLFFVLAALQGGADSAAVARAERTILAEVERIANEGPQAERLEQARKSLQVDRLFSLQRPRDRAAALGRGMLVSDRGAAALAADAKAAADAAAVREAAARLAARAPVTVWMMPAGGAEAGR